MSLRKFKISPESAKKFKLAFIENWDKRKVVNNKICGSPADWECVEGYCELSIDAKEGKRSMCLKNVDGKWSKLKKLNFSAKQVAVETWFKWTGEPYYPSVEHPSYGKIILYEDLDKGVWDLRKAVFWYDEGLDKRLGELFRFNESTNKWESVRVYDFGYGEPAPDTIYLVMQGGGTWGYAYFDLTKIYTA